MKQIVAISGSLRKESFNSALLKAAVQMSQSICRIDVVSIADIPLFNEDVQLQSGIPKTVSDIKDKLTAADALLLVSPEYNHSIPGPLKNAIDWMSRPNSDVAKVFANKAVGLIGTTPGVSGTRFAQTAWLPVFRVLGMRAYFGKTFFLSDAKKAFDPQLQLIDPLSQKLLAEYMSEFVKFI